MFGHHDCLVLDPNHHVSNFMRLAKSYCYNTFVGTSTMSRSVVESENGLKTCTNRGTSGSVDKNKYWIHAHVPTQ